MLDSDLRAERCSICGGEGSSATEGSACAGCQELLVWCRQQLSELLEVPAAAITLEADLEHELGADSLDLVELVMEVEAYFDVQVPDEEALKQMRTLADAVRYIQTQTRRVPASAR
ncbi:MAG: acyl carrier protein [Pirellulales bacterium]|nr:acyl carrier protein [Pirellulales bacterium]